MRQVNVIGIGMGSPGQLTADAAAAIRACDHFIVADKGDTTSQLVQLRTALVEAVHPGHYRLLPVPDPSRGDDASRSDSAYAAAVVDWHDARAAAHAGIIEGLPADAVVGYLVVGDPAFYDSTIRLVHRLRSHLELRVQVFPGITAFQALAAAHGVVLHEVGEPVHVTTGRRLLAEWGTYAGTTVVMLDGHLTCAELAGAQPDLTLWWGACLGFPQQQLHSGRLAEVIDEIRSTRARLRAEHGWVMDVYALSSSSPSTSR